MLQYFRAMRTRNSIKKPPSRNTMTKKTSTPRKPRMKRGLVDQESVDIKNYKGNSATAKSPDVKEEQPSTSKSGSYRKTLIRRKKVKEAVQEPVALKDSGADLISEKPFDETNESSRSNSPSKIKPISRSNSPNKNSETSKLISPPENAEALRLNSPGKNKRTSRSKSPIKNKEIAISDSPSKKAKVSRSNTPIKNKRTSNLNTPDKNNKASTTNTPNKNKKASTPNTPNKNKKASTMNTPNKNKKASRLNTPDKNNHTSTSNTPDKNKHTSTLDSAGTIPETEEEDTMKEVDPMADLGEKNETSHVSKVSNENYTHELISGQTSENLLDTVNTPEQSTQKEPSSEVFSRSTISQNQEPFPDYSSKNATGNSAEKDNSTLKSDIVKPEKKIKFNLNPEFKVKYNEEEREDFYECPLCYKEFPTRKKVKRHYRIHVEEKTFVCTQCDMKFLAKWDFKIHNESFNHGQKKLYECSLCGKAFTTKYLRGQHENTHKGIRFRCKGCHKSYVYKRDLVRHVKIHHLDLDPSEDTKLEAVSDDDEGPKFNYINKPSRKYPAQEDFPNPDGMNNVHHQIIPAQVVEVHFDKDPEKETDKLENGQDSRVSNTSRKNVPSQSLVKRRYADLETRNSGLLPQNPNKLQDSTSDNNTSDTGSVKKRKKNKRNDQSFSQTETGDRQNIRSLNDNVTEETEVTVAAQDRASDHPESGEFELTTPNQDSQNEGELRIYIKSPENTPDHTPIKRNTRYEDSETYNSGHLPEDPNKLQDSTSDKHTSELGSAKKRKKKKSHELSLSLTEAVDPPEIPSTSDNLTQETDPLTVKAQDTGNDQHECPVCDRVVTSIRKLQKHLKKKHCIDSV